MNGIDDSNNASGGTASKKKILVQSKILNLKKQLNDMKELVQNKSQKNVELEKVLMSTNIMQLQDEI